MPFDPKPNRLSPLHNLHQSLNASLDLREGWLIPELYTTSGDEIAVLQESVGLIDISARGKLILKGAHADAIITACLGEAPTKPGNVIEIESNHTVVPKLAPDEFMILTPPGAEKEIASALEAEIASQDVFVSMIDQTSGMVGLSIAGPKSPAVMKKLCALPFDSKDFPDLRVAQSSFASVRGMIIHHNRGGSSAFELFADRSYGEYLWEAILDAGREHGIQPVGWVVLENLHGQI
jgi:heterotetrameric sarcosine oxidase gamma subunit